MQAMSIEQGLFFCFSELIFRIENATHTCIIKLLLLALQTVLNPGLKQGDSTTVSLNRISVKVITVSATSIDEVPADASLAEVQVRSPSQPCLNAESCPVADESQALSV